MQTPVKIAFHHLASSQTLTRIVQEKVSRLERYCDRITACSVTLEVPDRHHRHGRHHRVRIELSVPGARLVVGRDPRENRDRQDLYAAIQAAFREAKRQLQDHARRSDRRVRGRAEAARAEPPRGWVARIFPQQGYGFIGTADGREIYFHERAVLHGAFGRLSAGDPVRFAEEMGEEGPQASTVAPARRERRSA